MSQICNHCKAELPDEAHFCPFCAEPLQEAQTPSLPRLWKGKARLVLAVALPLLLLFLLLFFRHKPQVVDAGDAEVVYEKDGVSWHLLLRNAPNDLQHLKTAQPYFTRTLIAGTQAAIPLQVYVYREDTGEMAGEEFSELLERSEIQVIPGKGSVPLEASNPVAHPGFPDALMVSDVVYDTDCVSNHIRWEFHMKNKDVLVLHEDVEIFTRPERNYSFENTPLQTVDDLNALLLRIPEEAPEDAAVTITLAPVTYEGDITLDSHSVSLVGSNGEEGRTTWRGTIHVETDDPQVLTIQNILFEGDGEGTALTGNRVFIVDNCEFRNLDTGLSAGEGSWPLLTSCLFTDCRIGFRLDSSSAKSKSPAMYMDEFRGNQTAILLEKIPSDDTIYLIDCVLEDNETDIDNRTANQVKLGME